MTRLTRKLLLLAIVGGTAWIVHAAWPGGGAG